MPSSLHWHMTSYCMVLIKVHSSYWHVWSILTQSIIHKTFKCVVLIDMCVPCWLGGPQWHAGSLLTCRVLIDMQGPHWHAGSIDKCGPIKLVDRFFENWYMYWCKYNWKKRMVFCTWEAFLYVNRDAEPFQLIPYHQISKGKERNKSHEGCWWYYCNICRTFCNSAYWIGAYRSPVDKDVEPWTDKWRSASNEPFCILEY